MTNIQDDVQENIQKEIQDILNVDENVLKVRIEFIQQKIKDHAALLREKLDVTTVTKELIENSDFKKWYIASEVLKQTYINGDTFNRLLYYMFEESHKNIELLLSYYDLEFEKDETSGEVKGITLVMLEE